MCDGQIDRAHDEFSFYFIGLKGPGRRSEQPHLSPGYRLLNNRLHGETLICAFRARAYLRACFFMAECFFTAACLGCLSGSGLRT
jgi:hypothetical protein